MMSAETMKRDRVFLRFEDADYYYRSTAVKTLQGKINAAVQAKDELAEIKAYEELGSLLSAGRDVTWRRKFFNDCLRPMADVIVSEKVRGYLQDSLGRQAFDIGMDDYIGYFERAVEFGNDSVFEREEVLRAHPKIIIRWIKCHLQKSARDAKVEEREALLGRIVASRSDAPDFYLELADALKGRYRSAADKYYRQCIRLGCGHVVDSEEFLREDYEADYIEWFKSLCASGVKPAEAAKLCFSPLWKVCKGSESHREYADSLWRIGAKRDAVAEYVRGAEAKSDWAELWLHAHSPEQMVYEGLSDALVVFADVLVSASRSGASGLYDNTKSFLIGPPSSQEIDISLTNKYSGNPLFTFLTASLNVIGFSNVTISPISIAGLCNMEHLISIPNSCMWAAKYAFALA